MIPTIKLYDNDYQAKTKGVPLHRGARGIILKDQRIAVIHYRTLNHFVLPGGGIEDGESDIEALKREILEEIGFHIKNIVPTVVVKEHFEDSVWQHHYFVADTEGDAEALNLTTEEKLLKPTILWKAPLEVLTLLSTHEGEHPHSQAIMQRELIGLMHSLSNGLQSL